MAQTLRLGNVLETMTDLTLARLLSFLQLHFKEGNASDLCGNLHQCPSSLRKVPISLLFVVWK